MRRAGLLLLLTLTLLVTPMEAARRRAVGSPPPETNLTTEEWLKRHSKPFSTAEPRTGFDDLLFLSSIVRDARIVSLGEATHGTHEFFTMKHRLFEYLVETMGFTVFGIEAALAECDAINDYVIDGVGDPSTALAGQRFWTWNTDEVLDLILWMREYNLRRGTKPLVYFRGFDMQFSAAAIRRARQYLLRIDPAGAAEITSQWNCFEPFSDNAPAYGNQSVRCTSEVAAAYATFESRRADYIARSSVAEYETNLHYARVIVQHEEVARKDGFPYSAFRDASMAENVVRLANVRHPGEKLVLWAHNYHVGISSVNTMGFHLREAIPGEEMVIFGFAFDHGSFNAVPWPALGPVTRHTVGPFSGNHDSLFRTAGHPRFIVDLRRIDSLDAQRIFRGPYSIWSIGAVFGSTVPIGNYRETTPLRDTYDAIIWFEETTPSKLRPF